MHLHDQFLANSRKFGSVLGLFHYMVPIAICLFVLLTCSTLFVFTRKRGMQSSKQGPNEQPKNTLTNSQLNDPLCSSNLKQKN